MSAPATVRVTRHFDAAPERVFDAWLEPDQVAQWFGAPAMKMLGTPDEIVRIDVDARVGGKFAFVVRHQGEVIEHVGEYLELDRPRRLAFTWCVPRYSKETTVVRLELSAAAGGTELTLVHERVAPEYQERTATGWSAILGAIADALG